MINDYLVLIVYTEIQYSVRRFEFQYEMQISQMQIICIVIVHLGNQIAILDPCVNLNNKVNDCYYRSCNKHLYLHSSSLHSP